MNNDQSQSFKKSTPLIVIVDFFIMRTAVNFDNNTAISAVKIHDIIANNLLSVKVKVFEFSLMQLLP